MLVLKHINKQYQVGKYKVQALSDINLQFQKSELVCVIGPSGCGKTTLLNIIGGLDKPSEGTFFVDGVDVSRYKSRNWDAYRNQKVGFVFQTYYLLPHLNVFENVELALSLISMPKAKRKELVKKALQAVGLEKECKNMPNQLSGGQMQRVAIARAIVNEPEIVLADEPTGALDSQTASQIMDILKSISKERLVILVTHNVALAKQYATRVIELLDGKLQHDSNPQSIVVVENKESIKQSKMRFFDTLRLSFKNMFRTKIRTMLSMIAGSIGIIGIGLVLSISTGVNSYIEQVQKSALSNYPITISSQSKKIDQEGNEVQEREEFPIGETVFIRQGEYKYDYYNVMDDDFLNYMDTLPNHLYTVIDYNQSITMNVLSQTASGYRKLSQSQFNEMSKDVDFVNEQYDVLKGTLPDQADEVAIIIDKYNALDALTLYYLGIDFENLEHLTFDQLLSKQFKLVFNDDLYVKQEGIYYTKGSSHYQSLYDNAQFTLKITGIMRVKKQANTVLYDSGLLYTPKLTQTVLENARQSAIYLDQLAAGLTKNVFTGSPYEDVVSYSSTTSKEYQLKQTYLNISALVNTNRIYVYTPTFADRLAINAFVSNYEDEESQVNISYYDYMNNVTTEFANLVKVFSTVLIIFSSISLVVSAIMIGIITYVSIFERIKDIGILRSVGARKWDIATLFNFETITIGLFSGILGVIGAMVLVKPVNDFVKTMIQEYTVSFSGISQVIVAEFQTKYIVLMIAGSVLLSFVSGLIPAVVASRKDPIVALKQER